MFLENLTSALHGVITRFSLSSPLPAANVTSQSVFRNCVFESVKCKNAKDKRQPEKPLGYK